MPIYALEKTLDAIGKNAEKCESRSLLKDKYVFAHSEMDEAKQLQLAQLCCDSVETTEKIRDGWERIEQNSKSDDEKKKARAFLSETENFSRRSSTRVDSLAFQNLDWLPEQSTKLYARLCSRMMLDMSGGVMENANVCLDRYGIPYIPGSAVKGCARRAALAALREWSQTDQKPAGDDNAFSESCQPFQTSEKMLEAIARIFGWGDMDWRPTSDFAWAMETNAGVPPVLTIPPSKQFSGSVAFLAAYPTQDPGLELDVLTPHHGEYYSSDNLNAVAHDTENPVPCYFPTVKSQKGTDGHYTFPLLPLARCAEGDLDLARNWLKCGLEIFGIGAKTAAGYGWFEDITSVIEQENANEEKLKSAEADTRIADVLRTKPRDELRSILNKFEYDNESLWPQQEPENTYEFQVTLLELYLGDQPLFTEALSAKRGKKALKNLAKKFNREIPN